MVIIFGIPLRIVKTNFGEFDFTQDLNKWMWFMWNRAREVQERLL